MDRHSCLHTSVKRIEIDGISYPTCLDCGMKFRSTPEQPISVHMNVADDISPETLQALGNMVAAVVRAVKNGTLKSGRKQRR